MNFKLLVEKAIEVRENAYTPYSHFKVGAAVLTDNNKIFTGVNIENSSYGATICAEQVAISKAVSEGERKIIAIAVVGNSMETYPCGICRQFMTEFADETLQIICADESGQYKSFSLPDILPYAFNKKSLIK